jgi:hypothetical protein
MIGAQKGDPQPTMPDNFPERKSEPRNYSSGFAPAPESTAQRVHAQEPTRRTYREELSWREKVDVSRPKNSNDAEIL